MDGQAPNQACEERYPQPERPVVQDVPLLPKLPRPLSIERVLNGFIVRVGCQTVVFQSLDEMQEELGNYLAYPKETEERFLINAKENI